MSSRSDELLRRLFRTTRTAAPVPSFDSVLSRRRPRPTRRLAWWLPVAVAGLLAVAVALPVRRELREREALEFALELAAWQAPSDRLLASYDQAHEEPALFRGLGEPSVLESTNEMVRWRN